MSDFTQNVHLDSFSLIEQIIAAEPFQRKRMINDFLESRSAVFNRLSYTIARKFSAEHAREDIRQIVMIEAHEMITEAVAHPERIGEIHSFEGMLQARSHARSRTYLDRDDVGITNITTIKRRQRMLMATREAMIAEAGDNDVTDQSVVDAHNTKVTASRANARKQGMIATVGDMRHNFTAAADDELAEIVGASDNTAGNHLLHPMEGKAFVSEMIRRCDDADPSMGEFSRAWLEAVYFDGDDAPNERDLGRKFKMTKVQVTEMIARIRMIARDALHETLDIGEDDYRDARAAV